MTIKMTPAGNLVYTDHDSHVSAVITVPGLRMAHDRDLAIGCHPYAAATAWVATVLLPRLSPAPITGNDAMIVADWCEWCDDVFARYAKHSAEESIASSAQQTGVITDARFCDEVNASLAEEEGNEIDVGPAAFMSMAN